VQGEGELSGEEEGQGRSDERGLSRNGRNVVFLSLNRARLIVRIKDEKSE
jgi:hypothetical protein